MHLTSKKLILAATVVFAGASACTGSQATVKDSWLARVPAEQMTPVYEAREEKRSAHDELVRAQVAVEDAERAKQVAKERLDLAEARIDVAQTRLKAAKATGQPEAIQEARAQLRDAQDVLALRKSELEWRDKVVAQREAEKKVEQEELDVEEAQLSYARYQALRDSGDVRARELSEESFVAAISKAQQEAAQARKVAAQKTDAVRSAHAAFQEKEQALQAYGGSGDAR